jgi:hypothetical protein
MARREREGSGSRFRKDRCRIRLPIWRFRTAFRVPHRWRQGLATSTPEPTKCIANGVRRGQGSGVVFGQSRHHTANPDTKTTPDPVTQATTCMANGVRRGQGSGVVFGQSLHHTANPSTKTTPDPVTQATTCMANGVGRGQGSGVVFGPNRHHTADPDTKTTPDPVTQATTCMANGVRSRFRLSVFTVGESPPENNSRPLSSAPPHRRPRHENDS